jgi:hypothetical protein
MSLRVGSDSKEHRTQGEAIAEFTGAGADIRFFLFEEDHLPPGEYSILISMRSPQSTHYTDPATTINKVVTIGEMGSKSQLFDELLEEHLIPRDWIVEFCQIRSNE